MELINLDNMNFNPQELMAERDINREKLIRDNKLKENLKEECDKKSKDEKQEFISKFIEYVVLDKTEAGDFIIEKVNFRSSFIEQLNKLFESGIFDSTAPIQLDGEDIYVPMSVNINQSQLDDYLKRLSKEFETEYYECFKVETSNESNKNNQKSIELVLNKSNEKIIRMVAVQEDKKFPMSNKVTIGAVAVAN